MISIIVALSENNAIGKENNLIWRISDDLKRFKKLTTNHSIIMGRKTFESLPNGALPNRKNIVISRNKNLQLDGTTVVNSLEQAIEICKNESEVFIIGGGEIYKHALAFADKLYLTKVHASFDADTFFPTINSNEWEIISEEKYQAGGKNQYPFSFIDLQRK